MIIEFVFEEFMANPTYVFANKIPGIASKNKPPTIYLWMFILCGHEFKMLLYDINSKR
jgi:hypothetical protein